MRRIYSICSDFSIKDAVLHYAKELHLDLDSLVFELKRDGSHFQFPADDTNIENCVIGGDTLYCRQIVDIVFVCAVSFLSIFIFQMHVFFIV